VRIGVIGTGNIGSMLAKGFAADPAAKVYLYNRTAEKAEAIARDWPNVTALASLRDIVWFSEVIFLCTKPADGLTVIRDIGSLLSTRQVLATSISSIPLATLRSLTHGKVAKVIPSIAQTVRTGTILVSYADGLDAAAQERLEHLLSQLGRPLRVDESQLRLASDLASCGPAFLAALLTEWGKTAANRSTLSAAECLELLQSSVIGLAELLKQGHSCDDIIRRVAVPGGVTEAGLTAIHDAAQPLFQRLHDTTDRHTKPSPVAASDS
jgi:competence protein ComER